MDTIIRRKLPAVSIILPCWRVEKFLDRCMESLLNQTLKEIEIILVDDFSPDKVPDMCDEYARRYCDIWPKVKVIHKEKNEGLGLARNTGLDIAEGEYVAFLDSDDFVDLHMFEVLYDYAKEYNLDSCYCGYNNYLDDNHIRVRREKTESEVCEGRNAIDAVLMDMVGAEPSYHSDVKILSCMWKGIYSMELIRKNNLQFVSEREYIAEDIMFHIDFLPHASRVGFVPGCYYYYCDNGDSLTRNYRSDRFERELYQVRAMRNKLISYGYNDSQFQARLDRYLLLKIRACISQQYQYVGKYGYGQMKKESMKIVSSPEVRDLCMRYPSNRLKIKHRIFFSLIKMKMVNILFLLFKIGIK